MSKEEQLIKCEICRKGKDDCEEISFKAKNVNCRLSVCGDCRFQNMEAHRNHLIKLYKAGLVTEDVNGL